MCLLGSESLTSCRRFMYQVCLACWNLRLKIQMCNYYTYRRSVHSLLFCQNDHQETTKFWWTFQPVAVPQRVFIAPPENSHETWKLIVWNCSLFQPFPAFSSWVIFSSMSQRCLALGWCKMGPIQFVFSSRKKLQVPHVSTLSILTLEIQKWRVFCFGMFWGVRSYQTSVTGCICTVHQSCEGCGTSHPCPPWSLPGPVVFVLPNFKLKPRELNRNDSGKMHCMSSTRMHAHVANRITQPTNKPLAK